MNNSTLENNTKEEVEYIELETDNLAESLVRNVVKGYEEAWNKNNEKNEIKFSMTITNHKVPTPDGNKNVAYLRIDRSIREKGPPKLIPNPEEGKPDIIDEGWETKLLHQEVHFFKNVKEQVDPRAFWKEQLYVNALARLVSAGLEYAELLQRLKPAKEAMERANQPQTEEDRLNKLGLVSAKQIPTPLSEDEIKYRDHIATERAKEGIK